MEGEDSKAASVKIIREAPIDQKPNGGLAVIMGQTAPLK